MKAKVCGVLFAFLIMSFNTVVGAEGRNTMENNEQSSQGLRKATFAGGCFWCMQPPFDKLEGVVDTVVGYCGGQEENPTYKEVSAGITGHTESIEVTFDPQKVTYEKLLDVFWRNINPTTLNQQFADIGTQYRTAIFYHDEEQKESALRSKQALEEQGRYDKPVVTEITQATHFYPAEDYHQDYYKKHAIQYKFYRTASGRDSYLKKIWGKEQGTR